MRRLIILLMALSLGPLGTHPGGAAAAPADPATDCIHQSADMPHHGSSNHEPETKKLPCCAGICFVLATLAPAPIETPPPAHALEEAADSRADPHDVPPADPPPRARSILR